MGLEVVAATSKKDLEAFLRLPWRLYKDDPVWIPNLLMLQRETFDRKKNPFFDHGDAQLFLARRDGVPVGRITAQINYAHNERHHEQTGFFGFFESEDNAETTSALFGAAEGWLHDRGMNKSLGPLNFTLNDLVGLQVDGFEHPPMIDTTQALPYYGGLVEGQGYTKAQDLLSYKWQLTEPPPRMMEAVGRTLTAPGLHVRKAELKHIDREVDILLDIYNDAWDQNWGYVPVSEREARKLANDLKLIVDTQVVRIAEVDGEPAGMIVGIPNLMECIRDFKGFIDPIKAIKLIWRLKVRGPKTGRILLFGVKRKFQRRRELVGLPFLLLHELYKGALKGRYEWAEESWILESNTRMNAIMPYWDAYVYKRHRIYEKAI